MSLQLQRDDSVQMVEGMVHPYKVGPALQPLGQGAVRAGEDPLEGVVHPRATPQDGAGPAASQPGAVRAVRAPSRGSVASLQR